MLFKKVPYFRVRFIERIPEEEYAKVLLQIVCTMIFRQHKRKQIYSRNEWVLEFIPFILIPKYCQSDRIMSQRQPVLQCVIWDIIYSFI